MDADLQRVVDDAVDESLQDDIDDDPINEEDNAAEAYFIQKGNDPKRVFAMAIGLENCPTYKDEVFKEAKNLRMIKPGNPHLVDEQIRRRQERGNKKISINKQQTRVALEEWLEKNPVENDIHDWDQGTVLGFAKFGSSNLEQEKQ